MAMSEQKLKYAGFKKMSDGSWWMVRDNADYYLTEGSDGSWMLLVEYADGHQVKRDGGRGESLELVLDNFSRGRGGLQLSDDSRMFELLTSSYGDYIVLGSNADAPLAMKLADQGYLKRLSLLKYQITQKGKDYIKTNRSKPDPVAGGVSALTSRLAQLSDSPNYFGDVVHRHRHMFRDSAVQLADQGDSNMRGGRDVKIRFFSTERSDFSNAEHALRSEAGSLVTGAFYSGGDRGFEFRIPQYKQAACINALVRAGFGESLDFIVD